jgi:hypothetical membrane protein
MSGVPSESGPKDRRLKSALAAGGVVGPAVFVIDWAVLGTQRADYRPVDDAISRLAEIGASTRPEMTAGFIVYGAGLVCYGIALRRDLPGSAGWLGIGTGLATFGVALFPLGHPTSGAIHAGFAVLGYIGLSALPLVAARRLRLQGRTTTARLATVAGAVSAAFLLASVVGGPGHGLTQRIGLTVGDAWVGVTAFNLIRHRADGGSRKGTAGA